MWTPQVLLRYWERYLLLMCYSTYINTHAHMLAHLHAYTHLVDMKRKQQRFGHLEQWFSTCGSQCALESSIRYLHNVPELQFQRVKLLRKTRTIIQSSSLYLRIAGSEMKQISLLKGSLACMVYGKTFFFSCCC